MMSPDPSAPQARLFVAVPIHEAARRALAQLSANLQKGFQFTPCRPSWSRPETMHVTLAFLGNMPRARIGEIAAALARTAPRFGPLVVEIKGLGVFPDWKRPRVLWAGLRERTHQLAPLREAVEQSLIPFGYRPEGRPFQPHLTLARFNGLRGIDAAHRVVVAHHAFRAPTFAMDRFILYESHLHPSGAQHTALETFVLTGSADHAARFEAALSDADADRHGDLDDADRPDAGPRRSDPSD